MIDLHMHTLHSDGELIPAELVRRAQIAGYRAMALTDHADQSNLEILLSKLKAAAQDLTSGFGIMVLAGVEITHVPPKQIPGLIRKAREEGAEVVVVHGETPVEPVAGGTNRAAIAGGADILAHPGMITLAEARQARLRGVALELSSRKGHCLTNGHVARVALQAGCALVINSDAHAVQDIHSRDMVKKVAAGAGLSPAKMNFCKRNALEICRRVRGSL
ncbi:histidinol phosphate phosphatase domain-containing protein [bacterium]|nr:histidinol phosphate phosphatase domain-containing protein [bacterium]